MNTQKLAVINLRLASVPSEGDPFKIVSEYLLPYFGDNLIQYEVLMDIDPEKRRSILAHQRRLAEIVKDLER